MADSSGIARVKIDAWRDTYKHILDPATLSKLDYRREASRWRDALNHLEEREAVWVACENDQVIGFAVAGPNRYREVPCDAELQAIYIMPGLQRRGTGRAMLSTVAAWLVRQGFESMVVFVFRDNVKGTSFYRKMGAERFDSGEYEIAGVKYPDESYVWKSLITLVQLPGNSPSI